MSNRISIKNMSSGLIALVAPNYNFRRELAPGREIPVDENVFNELTFDPGFQTLARAGYIQVNGLEEEGVVDAPAAETMVDIAEIKKILSERDITKFAKFIPTSTEAARETIVQLAVSLNVTDPAFTALIKKYCGVDIVNAITIARQSEE